MEIAILEERIRVLHAQLMDLNNQHEELKIKTKQITHHNDWLSNGMRFGDERNSRLLQQIKRLTDDNIALAQQCTQQTSINETNKERLTQMNDLLLEKKKQLLFSHKVIREKDQIISRFRSSTPSSRGSLSSEEEDTKD